MFAGVRSFDWLMFVIETAVLALIGYEVIVGAVRHRREQRRRANLNGLVAEISALMEKGLRLRSTVPLPDSNWHLFVQPWIDSVNHWCEETNGFLATHSARASQAFLLVTDSGSVDNVVQSGGRQFVLLGLLRERYQPFVVQLSNLRRIIERPEAYF